MTKPILSFLLLLNCIYAQSQKAAPPEYFSLAKEADSLFKLGEYFQSGLKYSAAFQTFGNMGYVDTRYAAACAWGKAGVPDSAFENLQRIAMRASYADVKKISREPAFEGLRKDVRWPELEMLVQANKDKNEASYNRSLLQRLDSMADADQKWRILDEKFQNGDRKSVV